MFVHYANLTNGLLCAPSPVGLTRIPSTWCEQGLWDRIAYGAGPDLLTVAAKGYTVIVHDQSEKQRQTRAQWQGLSWLRYACSVAWGLPEPTELSRNGMDVAAYWREVWGGLDRADRAWIEYFGRFASELDEVRIQPCTCPRQPWTHGDGKKIGT